MTIFNRMSDYSTGNSRVYEKESQIYNEIIQQIEKIFGLLENKIDSDDILDYVFELNGEKFSLKSLKDYIQMKRKIILRNNDGDIQRLISELNNYYEIMKYKIKDKLLQNKEYDDIQECLYKINGLIYSNLIYEPLKKYTSSNIIEKKWTLEELEKLKNDIYNRKVSIQQYLSKLPKR